MKKNTVLFLIAAAPLFPALSRFSAGLLLGVEFCLFFPVLLGIRKLLALCEIRRGFYLLTETVCLTLTASFYSGIIKWIFPVSALSLEFFYLRCLPVSVRRHIMRRKTGKTCSCWLPRRFYC